MSTHTHSTHFVSFHGGGVRSLCAARVPTVLDPGSPLGCAMRVKEGALPNEYGTWLYGRGGWCDGLQVEPWVTDVTGQVSCPALRSQQGCVGKV